MRTRFQGVTNIVRFNWHFFLAALVAAITAFLIAPLLPNWLSALVRVGSIAALLTTAVSLVVSWLVYDRSDLYSLNWLDKPEADVVVNINAGLDEVSQVLESRCPTASLLVWDFYDEEKHTEVSIKRARRAYPPRPETRRIQTSKLPLEDSAADLVVLFMAAHEIRNHEEREKFFAEVHRILKTGGTVVVTEHLRDIPNFSAYTVGAFHFHSHSTWCNTLKAGGFENWTEQKENPFVSTFIATK